MTRAAYVLYRGIWDIKQEGRGHKVEEEQEFVAVNVKPWECIFFRNRRAGETTEN